MGPTLRFQTKSMLKGRDGQTQCDDADMSTFCPVDGPQCRIRLRPQAEPAQGGAAIADPLLGVLQANVAEQQRSLKKKKAARNHCSGRLFQMTWIIVSQV